MLLKDIPIQRKLMTVILLTSGTVLLLTCAAYFAYEFFTYRQTTVNHLSTLGEIIATNSTAALAFDSQEEGAEILTALKAERNIVAACLYDENGVLFSYYPSTIKDNVLPKKPEPDGYRFEGSHLVGFHPIVQGTKRLGTLYLKSDMGAIAERFKLYAVIALLVIGISSVVAYFLSKYLQQEISKPIVALAEIANIISTKKDYSVRATKIGNDELGQLTDAFNQMLTEIQQQNIAITSFNQKLEQVVLERTREMEMANKELESFSYSVSHDLRAPLRSIHGYINIFSEEYAGQFDDEAKRLVSIILRNSQKMGQLIDDLLAFSQLGRKELLKAQVSMTDIVTGIWDEQIRMEPNRSIELVLLELQDALADNVTIKQVWTNLISNAIKYTRHTTKAIIEIGAEDRATEIMYYVRDNGAGFDMQYYDKLFGVFQRLHSQNEFDGTGVGLAIVQRILAKHGGRVWAEAKPNEGATFYFTLTKKR
jgi:signal transduction histidine kinase